MRVLRFDSIGGASGDMILAGLVGLGVTPDSLMEALDTLGVGSIRIRAEPVTDRGLAGTRVTVEPDSREHHPHRTLPDIEAILQRGRIPGPARDLAQAVFLRLAEAEARVHGTSVSAVHFHEVGALDSIADIVGACVGLDQLGVTAVEIGPLPEGRGTTQTAHGVLPIPVPAVVELLAGHLIVETEEPFELVTPTGAALLSTWSIRRPACPGIPLRIARTALGFGHRALRSRANALRLTLLDAEATSDHDECLVLECNIDDTIAELIGSLTSRLMEAGALDVFTAAVQMKKQRPGVLLTILCRPADRDSMLDLVFRESTTLGIREYPVRRTVLDRRLITVSTPFGAVRVKVGTWKGQAVTRAPEHEDCVRQASAHGVSVRQVYEAAQAAAGDAV